MRLCPTSGPTPKKWRRREGVFLVEQIEIITDEMSSIEQARAIDNINMANLTRSQRSLQVLTESKLDEVLPDDQDESSPEDVTLLKSEMFLAQSDSCEAEDVSLSKKPFVSLLSTEHVEDGTPGSSCHSNGQSGEPLRSATDHSELPWLANGPLGR
ncbi:hypothetical protein DPEC_G00187690 [Dallia pectoralis]|uniref:Uncharacterized protein n=1 Tax=Dallia pectoralis TaxID=75939 RepID=A0ACC2GBR6_DALPE|nr:hypothetical protein DPEC_G00187690 [Dallia pectoralis]